MDATDWAVDRFAGLVEGLVCPLMPTSSGGKSQAAAGSKAVWGSVTFTRLQQASGHAQVVSFQGKLKYLFDLSFELAWVADVVEGEDWVDSTATAPRDNDDDCGPALQTGEGPALQIGEGPATSAAIARSKRRRFKGVVCVSGVEQDLADGSDVSVSVANGSQSKWRDDPAMAAVKRFLEAAASSAPPMSAAAADAAAVADAVATEAPLAGLLPPLPFESLRDALLARATAFEADFRQLGSGKGLQGHSSDTGDGSPATTAGGSAAGTNAAVRRSARRRDPAADVSARAASVAAMQQEAKRAAAVADLRRTNPNLKIDL